MKLERIPVSSPASVAVFRKILTHGPIARTDVAKRTGLSAAAVTKAVHPLINAGYVQEAHFERGDVGRGRPMSPLEVTRGRSHVIGVKVTADGVYAVLTDLGAVPLRSAQHEMPGHTVDEVVLAITTVVERLVAQSPGITVSGVGVSVSGDVDMVGGVVRDSPLLGWKSVGLRDSLELAIAYPVTIENDVRALTTASQMFGLGVDASSFAVVTIGAGIGCGIFVNGEVVQGAFGVSGELGHLPLAPGDLMCSCGRRGCVETVASSSAILERVRTGLGDSALTMDDAIALAHDGDQTATAAFAEAGEVIGAALAALVNLIGPELVIIAGEGVAEYDLLADRIKSTFSEHVFGSAGQCEIVVRSHTFDEWAQGAAVMVIREIATGEQ